MPKLHERKGPGIHSESSNQTVTPTKEPRLSNDELEKKLRQSGQARRRKEERLAEESPGDNLETLESERLRRWEVSQAKEQYEAAFAEAQAGVTGRHERREKVVNLITETDETVKLIIRELDFIHRADIRDYQKLEQAYRTWFHSGGQNRWQDGIPDTAQAIPDSIAEWLRCIGSDEKLQTISPYDDSSPLRKAITESVNFIYYNVGQLRRLQSFGLSRFANPGRK